MATRLHLLTFGEQYRQRQQRRTNRRLLFVAAYCLLVGFLVGTLVGCGAGDEPVCRQVCSTGGQYCIEACE